MTPPEDQLPTAEQAVAYARVIGSSPVDAMRALLDMDSTLRSRVLRATSAWDGEDGLLHDPIEDEPSLRRVLKEAEKQATESLTNRGHVPDIGYCHLLWQEKADILRARYGITWFSPAEMNPHALID